MLSIDLKGKVAIVTGATQGIGFGIATVLAQAGCSISACGLSPVEHPKVQKLIGAVEACGQEVYYRSTDVTKEEEIAKFVQGTVNRFSQIDILISNAGVNMFTAPESCESDFWDSNADLNLKSHWMMSKACYPYLKESCGVIQIMSSNHAYQSMPGCFPYNVTKAGLIGLVSALSLQWGPEVRVIGLAPGFIQTKGGDDWFNHFDNPEEKRNEILRIHPLKRFGTPEEIGGFCAFLSSRFAAFISGTVYLVDGGRSVVMQDV